MEYQKVHCLLDALRATVIVTQPHTTPPFTVQQTVWTDEEVKQLKTEILNQLLTPTKTTNEQ